METRPLADRLGPGPISQTPPPAQLELRAVAREFEVVFLAEMLEHTGLGRMPETFNGGPGEAAFSSLLTREYAKEIARSGRLGLAESVYRSLGGATS